MKKKDIKKVNIKELSIALDRKIEEQKQRQLGGKFEKDGDLFKPKASFNLKTVTKSEYSQLYGLYDFMKENPNVTTGNVRRLLRYKAINYNFLNKCDQAMNDFLEQLITHGPSAMAEFIEKHHKAIEDCGLLHL